ncbi:hypothetical protein H257_15789 [Aphanomyces astaci]|uniref:Uncharacterized protein n=1 Tax=Aphanomyces astaci TaxID=112090 RepID=W4FL49_APHAT|nr:hypothetical protein H257_15789 [Aphanomyces astaci]ETV68210.1 hypothetical protein H257_15789 [Aphanomyces astaci]|eukprot:XP_009842295.1 hypothetical protein H257_15789 [Aphanomyces astaci]
MTQGRLDLINMVREAILREVLLKCQDGVVGRLPRGFGNDLATKYGCHVSSVRRSIARAKAQGIASGNMQVCVANRKKVRVGRKIKYTASQAREKLLQVPSTARAYIIAIHLRQNRYGTLHRYLKRGVFRAHSNAIRPMLTDVNKYCRLKFELNFMAPGQDMCEMLDYVHLDEKWFYLTLVNRKFYLVPGEKPPERKCKSKRFITKVMFLTAVARPRLNEDTGVWWDGKIGTWPFVKQAAALRSSVNREAGTIETKVISVTKDVYRAYLLGKVLAALVQKWPSRGRTIMLQHDNARAHVTTSDAKLQESFRQYAVQGWSFQLAPQPANSPDLNVLDLGFFAALQSLQHRESARTIDDLVANVAKAFKDYPFERLDHTFMTLQSCLLETIRVAGDNTYKIPHLRKQRQARLGILPRNLICPTEDYRDGTAKLSAIDAVAYERAMETELDELRTADELSTYLKSMTLDSDVTAALEAAGLEANSDRALPSCGQMKCILQE